MRLPALRDDELATIEALRALDVLDTAPEAEFDALVRAASMLCGTPISLVSLVDSQRQWFKANVGLPGVTETPRDVAFCAHAVLGSELFEVEDAAADPRFAENPLVAQAPNIRFYAGVPLTLPNGSRVGTLCVIDRQPRRLTEAQREVLAALGVATVRALEGRQALLAHAQLSQRLTLALGEAQRAEARFRSIAQNSPFGVYATNAEGGCTFTNAVWQGIFGLTEEESIGTGWASTLHPEDSAAVFEEWQRCARLRLPFDMSFRIRRRDGTERHVRSRAQALHDELGETSGFVGAIEDVTERRQLQAQVQEQADLMRVTLQSISDAVITTDPQARVRWLNPVAERLTGWETEAARGRPLEQVFCIVNEDTRKPSVNPVATCLREDRVVGLASQTVLISADGTEYGIEDSAAPIRNERGAVLGAVLVFHDVTESRALSRIVTHRATHDSLTGLVNRDELELRLRDALGQAAESTDSSALLLLDLDQFKVVNDTGGHAVGDRLLQQISVLLRDGVRAGDTVARMGGDEFALLLPRCPQPVAMRIAQKLCDRIDEFRFIHEEHRFRVGASIGVVSLDASWRSVDALLQAADSACYAAKEGGRNRVHMWLDSDAAVVERRGEMQWIHRIEQALDDARFVLYAQRIHPLGEAGDGLHAEVLLRMRGEDDSLVAPGIFLPVAERYHLASRIDRLVLKQSLDWLCDHPAAPIATLSVNLSGQSVGDRAFHRWALEEIARAQLQVRKRLCVEITETAAITRPADATLFVERLRAAGVRVALDDFGAGASSFGYLKSMPVDYLKIDGQFIRGMLDNGLDEAAVRCFVDVARVAGIQTVAEFVDNPAVLARLAGIGVDFAQGFLLHRPAPIAELLKG